MKRFLVSRTDKLGDVILSLPVVNALRRKFPDSRIFFLARNYTREILECCPHIDKIITIDDQTGIRKPLRSLALEMKQHRLEYAVILYPGLYTAVAALLANIPERIGSGFRWYSFLFTKRVYEHRKTCQKHEAEYNLGLLHSFNVNYNDISFDIDVPGKESETVAGILNDNGISGADTLIIIHPGSRGSSLDWNPDNIPPLIELIQAKTGAKIVLTGTQAEKEVLNNIVGQCRQKPVIFEKQLTLKELAALLKRADLFIANSTGPLHLANALGTEVIGIYPDIIPLNSVRWGPYGRDDSIITPDVPDGVKRNKNDYIKHHIMDTIKPEAVYLHVEKKINQIVNKHT